MDLLKKRKLEIGRTGLSQVVLITFIGFQVVIN